MGFFGTLLLLFFIFFIVIPIVRVAIYYRRARRRMRDLFDQMQGGGRPAGDAPDEGAAPAPRRKKIDPAVGEYVDFEEYTVEETVTASAGPGGSGASATTRRTTTVSAESQITDVEWEDI